MWCIGVHLILGGCFEWTIVGLRSMEEFRWFIEKRGLSVEVFTEGGWFSCLALVVFFHAERCVERSIERSRNTAVETAAKGQRREGIMVLVCFYAVSYIRRGFIPILGGFSGAFLYGLLKKVAPGGGFYRGWLVFRQGVCGFYFSRRLKGAKNIDGIINFFAEMVLVLENISDLEF
ncbi:MAG: hypothetical protein EA411_00920 [Saprospirales bacterium]|nr:MAG: hypothetical protein EA411_00920 [Saprospirales bacterium]